MHGLPIPAFLVVRNVSRVGISLSGPVSWPAPTVWEPELGVIGGSSGVHFVVEDRVAGTLRLAAFVGASSRLSMLLWS